MFLTNEEKSMLDGKFGEPVQKAMRILVTLGEAYGAKRMIKINNVHFPGASIVVAGEAGVNYVNATANNGGVFKTIMTTTNPTAIDPEKWERLGIDENAFKMQKSLTDSYQKMGAFVCGTCTPYQIGNCPLKGEHIAWGESSAVAFSNSILGARTNREGGPTALAAALTGRVPAYGLHLDENRFGDFLVDVKAELKNITDYGTLGYYIGGIVENKVPVFKGIPKSVTIDQLKMLGAALASSGAVALYHIIGITPEAPTMKSVFKKENYQTIEVSRENMEDTEKLLTKAEDRDIHWVVFGCPHLSINEISYLSEKLEGKKIHSDVEVWLNTSVPVKEYAKRLGMTQKIEEAGAQFICETCPIVGQTDQIAKRYGFKNLVTNSAKLAHYVPGQFGIMSIYGNTDKCIDTAINKEWRD